MKAKLFFPFVILIALGMIIISLMPLVAKKDRNIDASFKNVHGKYVAYGLGLNDLIFYDKKQFAASLAPGVANMQTGPRFISKQKQVGDDSNFGVKVQLPKNIADAFMQKPAKNVVIDFEPMNLSMPQNIRFSFVGNNYTQNFQIIDLKTQKSLRFTFDAPMSLKEIIINPALEGEDHGIEIKSIVIEN